jgi:hypothetical protein
MSERKDSAAFADELAVGLDVAGSCAFPCIACDCDHEKRKSISAPETEVLHLAVHLKSAQSRSANRHLSITARMAAI